MERVLVYEQVVGGRAWTGGGEGPPPKQTEIICFRCRVSGSGDKLNQAQMRGKETICSQPDHKALPGGRALRACRDLRLGEL